MPGTASATLVERIAVHGMLPDLVWRRWPLLLGLSALAAPTLARLASELWATEAGAHGPVVLATGLWLLARRRKETLALARPGSLGASLAMMAVALLLHLFGRIGGILGVEAFSVHLVGVALLYAWGGMPVLRLLWFPLAYLLFLVPPPDMLLAAVTQPLKIGIAALSAGLLGGFGYPVIHLGVTLQVAQYELLVAAACSGINSIVSLAAVGSFYAYALHNSSWRYMAALLLLVVLPMALLANLVRVLGLVLVTCHLGDAAAQSYLHDFAGLVMLVVAVAGVFAADRLLMRVLAHVRQPA